MKFLKNWFQQRFQKRSKTMTTTENYKVKDISLAKTGQLRVDWAKSHMPVLAGLVKKYKEEQPLKGQRIAGCLHVTKETAVLVDALRQAGGEVSWSGCNPLSTQDDVAAVLAQQGVGIYAWYGMNRDEFYWAIDQTLTFKPTLTLDDGADLITRVHTTRKEFQKDIIGGTEETTTGVHRLRSMEREKVLGYPIMAVNDSETKWDFDNVYGTGQSSLDGILRATSVLIAGKNFVVAGYGHCGRGCATRARGMGARVIVTEVLPTAALKARLEGFEVMTMDEAAKLGDIFITATGMKDVITGKHMASMRDGAIVCNTGHYDSEINIPELEAISAAPITIRDNCEKYTRKSGGNVFLLAKGRLVNLAAAEGHPSEVMDMSFANQFLAMIKLAKEGNTLENRVYTLPKSLDQEVAQAKLDAWDVSIDTLTQEQIDYGNSYLEGT
jgi:adenosylhomocysteinase